MESVIFKFLSKEERLFSVDIEQLKTSKARFVEVQDNSGKKFYVNLDQVIYFKMHEATDHTKTYGEWG